ncbi:MAG: hypothetical protein ACRCYQ_05650 [Nocardioides sp.]
MADQVLVSADKAIGVATAFGELGNGLINLAEKLGAISFSPNFSAAVKKAGADKVDTLFVQMAGKLVNGGNSFVERGEAVKSFVDSISSADAAGAERVQKVDLEPLVG